MKRQRRRQLPRAATFSSKCLAATAKLCRELEARGLRRERDWIPGSPVAANTFRTYVYEATRTLPKRYLVRYQDQTPGARVVAPRKPARPKSDRLPQECATPDCGRPRVYLDGYCKRCHDRERYATDEAHREKKKAQAIANGKRRRADKRVERRAA